MHSKIEMTKKRPRRHSHVLIQHVRIRTYAHPRRNIVKYRHCSRYNIIFYFYMSRSILHVNRMSANGAELHLEVEENRNELNGK